MLADYLEKNKIIQIKFANSVGITQPYLSQMLRGKCNPKMETLNRVVAACGGDIRMEHLLQEFKPKIYEEIYQALRG